MLLAILLSSTKRGREKRAPWPTTRARRTRGSCGGRAFPGATYGHTGFTGTAIQIDPVHQIFAIFLANRVHARSGEWDNPDFRSESYARFRPVRVAFFDTVAETFD